MGGFFVVDIVKELLAGLRPAEPGGLGRGV